MPPKASTNAKAIKTQANNIAKSMASLSLKAGNKSGSKMMSSLKKK